MSTAASGVVADPDELPEDREIEVHDVADGNADRAEMPCEKARVQRVGQRFDETGTSPGQLRQEVLADRPAAMQTIVDRAVRRGEYPAAAFTPRVTRVPFDLLRSEILMTLRPVSRSTITDIVDDVFLPLLGAHTADVTGTGTHHTPAES